MSQADKAIRFRELHKAPGAFVIANAWDAGSARILAGAGFVALATSSGAAAAVLGRRDGMITREESLTNARTVVEATDLPVSADLEKGFSACDRSKTRAQMCSWRLDCWIWRRCRASVPIISRTVNVTYAGSMQMIHRPFRWRS